MEPPTGLLEDYHVSDTRFREIVKNQYEKKFGRFGDEVVESNMTVMTKGFELVQDVPPGEVEASDRSSMREPALAACDSCSVDLSWRARYRPTLVCSLCEQAAVDSVDVLGDTAPVVSAFAGL